jgi:hypothetical protein
MALENWTCEGNDYVNVSDVPVVFLDDAWGIRLEYHQVHKPFSVSMNLPIYVCHGVLFSLRGCRLLMGAELTIRL